MIIFYTSATDYLSKNISLPKGSYTKKQFSDNELYIRVNQEVTNKQVCVIANTQPPAQNLLELFFLLDALKRSGAQVKLFISYFAYARQLLALPGEANSGQVIATIFNRLDIQDIFIFHAHNTQTLHQYLLFQDVHDIDFFCKQAVFFDAIATPDKGAFTLAKHIAQICKKDLIILTKTRPDHEQVKIIEINGNVQNKNILLIDDIISTGGTLIEATQALKKAGSGRIAAAAIHGIFAPGSKERLAQSHLESITVTNSVKQQTSDQIQVINIAPLIMKILEE